VSPYWAAFLAAQQGEGSPMALDASSCEGIHVLMFLRSVMWAICTRATPVVPWYVVSCIGAMLVPCCWW
jgi:hypothetical protein